MKIGMMSFAHLHAEAYIQNLRAIPGVEMIGIADDDLSRGQKFAAQFQSRLFPSYEALLNEQPDGVIICSENSTHRALVELAAQAGAHILCEKPLATTLKDAQAILDCCDEGNLILMTAFPMRFSVPIVEVKQSLERGELGELYACNTTNQAQMPSRGWFVDQELAGGGAIMDHTVHLADLLRWYLKSEVVELFAQSNHILHANSVAVETGGLIMLTFANGCFASIDCSWSKPFNYPTWGGLTMELITTRGLLTIDAFSQSLTQYRSPSKRHRLYYWGDDANQAMIEEFVSAIREERQASVTGLDGYKALEITLAAYQSAQNGQPVKL